jgi:hypothetical protein
MLCCSLDHAINNAKLTQLRQIIRSNILTKSLIQQITIFTHSLYFYKWHNICPIHLLVESLNEIISFD